MISDAATPLSKRWLFWPLHIATLSWAVVLLDSVIPGGLLPQPMMRHPTEMAWWPYIWGYPHIFAGFIVFSTQKYYRHFPRQILFAVFAIPALMYGASFLSEDHQEFFRASVTLIHVINQQTGIAVAISGVKNFYLNIWRDSMFILFLVTFAYKKFGLGEYWDAPWFLFVCSTIILFKGMRSVPKENKMGRLYLLMCHFLFVSCLAFYGMDLTFFVTVCLRITHDITAFSFYYCHNRSVIKKYSIIYVITFVLPFVFYALSKTLHVSFFALALLHYFIEHSAWKGNSPIKAKVRLVP